jgi:hypothetical protein
MRPVVVELYIELSFNFWVCGGSPLVVVRAYWPALEYPIGIITTQYWPNTIRIVFGECRKSGTMPGDFSTLKYNIMALEQLHNDEFSTNLDEMSLFHSEYSGDINFSP